MSDIKDIKKVVGYGEKVSFFIGKGEDGADENGIREFHVTPVGIVDLPELSEAIDKFQSAISGSLLPEQTAKLTKNVQQLSEAFEKVTDDDFDYKAANRAISKLDDLVSQLQNSPTLKFSKDAIKDMTTIARLSFKRSGENVTDEQIGRWFNFSALVKISKLALSVNELQEEANATENPQMMTALKRAMKA